VEFGLKRHRGYRDASETAPRNQREREREGGREGDGGVEVVVGCDDGVLFGGALR